MYNNLAQSQQKHQQTRQNNQQTLYTFERHHSPDDIRYIMQQISSRERAVLFLFISLGKRYHRIFPSLLKLVALTGFSKTSIIRYIRRLELLGLINVRRSHNKGSKKDAPNTYILNPILLMKEFSNVIYSYCAVSYFNTVRDIVDFSKDALVRMWTLYKNFIKGINYLRSSKSIYAHLFGEYEPSRDGSEEQERYVADKKVENEEEEKNLQRETCESPQEVLSIAMQNAINALTHGVSKIREAYTLCGYASGEIQQRVNSYLAPYLNDLTNVERLTLRKKGLI